MNTDNPKSVSQHTTPERIESAMTAEDRTKKWTAEKSGIPYTTFLRKLAGYGEFTIGEIARIARALSIDPASLLPAEFGAEAATEALVAA